MRTRGVFVAMVMLLAGCSSQQPEADLAWARGVRPFVMDRAIIQEQKAYRDAQTLQGARQFSAAKDATTPVYDLLVYPPGWPDISERRDAAPVETAR